MAKTPASSVRKKPAAKPPAQITPPLEWATAGLGLLCVLATAGVLASEVFRADATPPDIVVRPTGVVDLDTGYLLTIEVANNGGSPAAAVVVQGAMTGGEDAEATFDFIADHSKASGGLYFPSDPRRGRVVLSAKGYADP